VLFASKPSASERHLVAGDVIDRPVRSLAKAVSWRITGSIDTIFLSWLFTGDLSIAAAIGLTEVLTKMVLYYLHERVWNRIPLGRAPSSRAVTGSEVDEAAASSTREIKQVSNVVQAG
jgi:uncharacterized membrane protein